jgi:hypothetical protein
MGAARLAALALGCLAWLGVESRPVAASETVSEAEQLHAALDRIGSGPDAERGGAGAEVMGLLADGTNLGPPFEAYFADPERELPDPLYDWLRATAFRSETGAERKLQAALAPALVAKLVRLFAERGEKLGPAAAADPRLGTTVANTLHLLAELAQRGTGVDLASRRTLYRTLARLIERHRSFLRAKVTLDSRAWPLLPTIRAQLYLVMRDLVPLDAPRFVADTGLPAPRARLLVEGGLLVLDNNCLDARQLTAIESLREAIPARLRDETHISVHRCLGTPQGPNREWAFRIEGSRGVNISGLPVAAQRLNQFPEDSEPIAVSTFCAVLQHELNHVVDAHGIESNPALAARKRELIARTGSEPRQFLRSQVEWWPSAGRFRSTPQEFFASIANQYLADSRQTLELGYERSLQGYAEPLNQFVFFLEVYSLGTDVSLFFRQDEACRYQVERVPLVRDPRGFIRGVVVDDTLFEFRVDESGNVVG